MARKRRAQNLRQARAFVETEFGRGSASVKVTRKPATAVRAIRNEDVRKRKKIAPLAASHTVGHLEVIGGATVISMGKSGHKQVMFLPRDSNAVHELTHAAYMRTRKRAGKPVFAMINETLGDGKQLDWNQMHNPREFRADLSFMVQDYGICTASPHATFPLNPSWPARAITYMIYSKFPRDINARVKVRQSLAKRGFRTFGQVKKWFEANF